MPDTLQDKIFCGLVMMLAFVTPLSTAGIPIVSALLLLAWVFRWNVRDDFKKMLHNPMIISVLVFCFVQLVGFAWTSGKQVSGHKFYLLLMVPVIASVFKREWLERTFGIFITAMAIAEVASYYKIITGWSTYGGAGASGYSAFMISISYAPFLSFSICLMIVSLVEKKARGKQVWILCFFITTMIINLFTTGGRAGQLAFGLLVVLLIIYYLKMHLTKVVLLLVCIPLIYWGAYAWNPAFRVRIDAAINDVMTFQANEETSVGLRIRFTLNSWELIKEKPFFGHGTGSFAYEYARKNLELTPHIRPTVNPHNMYILSLVQQGILGFTALIMLFATQIYLFAISKEAHYRALMLVLPVLFLVICISDSYLFGVRTQALFVLMSSLLFSNANIYMKKSPT